MEWGPHGTNLPNGAQVNYAPILPYIWHCLKCVVV